jgi:hypothetical protein
VDEIEQRYRALVERIIRYPVTDPEARARMLAEVEAAYRKEVRAARSPGALTAPGTGHDDSSKLWKKFRPPRVRDFEAITYRTLPDLRPWTDRRSAARTRGNQGRS